MSIPDALPEGDKTLLLVDDDKAFLTRLERAMEKRGFAVRSADTVAAGSPMGRSLKVWKYSRTRSMK